MSTLVLDKAIIIVMMKSKALAWRNALKCYISLVVEIKSKKHGYVLGYG